MEELQKSKNIMFKKYTSTLNKFEKIKEKLEKNVNYQTFLRHGKVCMQKTWKTFESTILPQNNMFFQQQEEEYFSDLDSFIKDL
jgi:hypothetical protein